MNRPALTLFELNSIIKAAINDTLPDTYWIIAEIAEAKVNQKGHCYLELVEKEEDKTIAQVKAAIWAYEYRKLSQKFQKAANEPLRQGMKILFLAAVTFHEVYGLSLNIKDIDPAYTMGEMALKKKEVIERLKKEGLLDLNKQLPLPLVPQKIAVISSPTAAGYGDFIKQLDNNGYGYSFTHILFPAMMQGAETEKSIISALNRVKKYKYLFDAVIIIRGGGSAVDLNCFDSYPIAAQIARFPLPVITGIGHEKDDTVADMTAHTKMKTPTAVAEFLISGLSSFEERILTIQNRLVSYTEGFLKDKRFKLNANIQRLTFIPGKMTASAQNRLLIFQKDLAGHLRQLFQTHGSRLEGSEQAVRLLDPSNLLRRGYSLTRFKGKIIKDAALLKNGALITTNLYKGTVTSIVTHPKEVKTSEQGQTTDLFKGID